MTLPMNAIFAKEFDLRGTFRFHEEFGMAVELLNRGLSRRQAAYIRNGALPRRWARFRSGGRSIEGDEGVARFRGNRHSEIRTHGSAR
jgi:hypothetical protein